MKWYVRTAWEGLRAFTGSYPGAGARHQPHPLIMAWRANSAKVRNPFQAGPTVIAKRTSKNQLTLPKAVVEQVGAADYYDVVCDNGRIVLTPLHPGGAEAVRKRLAELGISEADVSEAVSWARQP